MKRFLKVLVVLFLAPVSLILSCERPSSDKANKPMFAFVINVPGRFWDIAHAGCLQAAKEENVRVEFHVPGQSSAAQQMQIVESLIAKGCKGLAISPLSPESMGRVIDRAMQQIPVICQDSDAPNSKRIAYIGTNNVEAGRIAGQELLKALPEGGQVAVFVGQLDVANARERYQGVQEALENSTCTIVEIFTDQGDRTQAQANVRSAVAKYPKLKGILGLWGYNGFCAASALRDYPGHNIKIIAFDEDIETFNAIRNGDIVSSVVQNPYEFGYQSIRMLARLNRSEVVDIPNDKLIYIPVRILNRDNVDQIEQDINHKLSVLEILRGEH